MGDFESRFNIHMYAFDDLDMVKEAVGSIPDDVVIYVLDGRYYDFPGEYDLTPGLEEWCDDIENVSYMSPPQDILPFGEGQSSAHRAAQNAKARWANEEALPQFQWSIQMDTDERLFHINREIFDNLKDDHRYRPTIPIDDGRTVTQPRIMKPGYWTYWIDDCAIPRDVASRDTELEHLRLLWNEHRDERVGYVDGEDLLIKNFGMSRPDEYLERRIVHLDRIKRGTRARKLEDVMEEGFEYPESWHESN